MRRELGRGLRHVFAASADVLWFDDGAAWRLCDALDRGGAYAPGVFGRYYELVDAIQAEEHQKAERLIAELCEARPVVGGMQVVALDDPGLGEDSTRYMRLMNGDSKVDPGFLPPSPEVAAAFQVRLRAGLALADRAVPELAAEVRAIVRQVVIAGGDPACTLQFDRRSHYQLWGALFLNGQSHPDAAAVLEVLAHESAHSLLFGFYIDEALVENDDGELFASPLRADKRPMDGIYHATFVSARTHWAMTRLAESGAVEGVELERARAAARADSANFRAGDGVVRARGRLTATGRALMEGARAYMDTVA